MGEAQSGSLVRVRNAWVVSIVLLGLLAHCWIVVSQATNLPVQFGIVRKGAVVIVCVCLGLERASFSVASSEKGSAWITVRWIGVRF